MTDFLNSMRAASLSRVRQAKAVRPLSAVVRDAQAVPSPAVLKPNVEGFDLIAEVKTSSPSAGKLSSEDERSLIKRAENYASAGAVAVSVLTEPDRFGGSLQHLQVISEKLHPLGVPTMRKDFVVDVYQVWEAAAAGAGGILLIIGLLDDHEIMEMLEAAAQARMFVLLEAFDEKELQRAVPFVGVHNRVLVGLNCRDLRTLEVDRSRFVELANQFPPNCLRVAESGLGEAKDVAAVAKAGYQLALVGTALMRKPEPADCIREFLTAGREATHW